MQAGSTLPLPATSPGWDDTEMCLEHGLGVNMGYSAGRYKETFSLSQQTLKGEQSFTFPETGKFKFFHKIKVI